MILRKRVDCAARQAGLIIAAFALWLAVALTCCVFIVGLANRASQRAAAQAAADAAALAGAAEGRGAAQAIAEANGAYLESFEAQGRAVTVRIVVSGIAAEARAEAQLRPR